MKAKMTLAVMAALLISVGAYAQGQPEVHKARPKLTTEQREARKAEVKAKLAQMTPAERKAFKQAHREQRQARLNAMTPEQRVKLMERRSAGRRHQHKEKKQQPGK